MRRIALLILAAGLGVAVVGVVVFRVRSAAENRARTAQSLSSSSHGPEHTNERGESESFFDILVRIVDDATRSSERRNATSNENRSSTESASPSRSATRPTTTAPTPNTLGGHSSTRPSDLAERSPQTETRSQLVVENTCTHAVELTWVTFEGTERVMATVRPGAMRVMGTYEGHIWRIRDAEDHSLLRSFVCTLDDYVEVCDESSPLRNHAPTAHEARSSVCSSPSDVAMPLTIVNRCTTPVEVTWVGYECIDRHYRNLAPGESYVQQTFATHVWHGLDADSHVLSTHIANPNVSTFEITCE